MTWIAPEVTRIDEPFTGPERGIHRWFPGLAPFHAAVEVRRADRPELALASVPPSINLSLRWVYTHMIEEYARHNGHADLLRQCIDGATGG